MLASLDRKLLRDLWHQWGQITAIALVVACGITCFVMMQSTHHSLVLTQTVYYDRYRFADVFADLTRAPDRVKAEIEAIPGVAQVATRIQSIVTLDVEGVEEPAAGRLISVPDLSKNGDSLDGDVLLLNNLYLQKGSWLDPQHPEEVLVNEAFATANQFHVGSQFGAILNGRWQTLRVVGMVLSPEHVYAVRGGSDIYPDNRRFGVLWMSETALSQAFDMEGAFNSVTLSLLPGANQVGVLDRLDQILEPYGGLGAYGREDQLSNLVLSDDIEGLAVSATLMPTIFLGIAAFLINVILSRLVATQREQIAVLKAFGYTNFAIGWHYLKLVLFIFSLGASLGIGAGLWLGRGLTEFYGIFYRFPFLEYEADLRLVVTALGVSGAAAIVGGLLPVWAAVSLPPAQAMRPEPPAQFRPTLVERWGLQRLFSPAGRMILRNLERRPLRAGLSILGVAAAAALLITGFFLRDGIDWLLESQFNTVQREDLTLVFNEPRPARTRYTLSHLPGVLRAEVFRSVPVRLHFQHYEHRLGLLGIDPEGELRQLIDRHLNPVSLPPEGVVLTRKLAEILHIQPGQTLTLEVLEGERPVRSVPVVGTVDEFLGLSAYMDLHALNRLMREGGTVSGAYLAVDGREIERLYRDLKQTPAVEGVSLREVMLKSFDEISGESLRVMNGVITVFAGIITFSVVYNSARIALLERSRELASLRIMGFTRTEISIILLGEQAILTLLAIPVGYGLGYGLSAFMAQAYNNELYRMPLIITRTTYGYTGAIVVIAALLSGLMIYRQLQHLDLIAVLKTRE